MLSPKIFSTLLYNQKRPGRNRPRKIRLRRAPGEQNARAGELFSLPRYYLWKNALQ